TEPIPALSAHASNLAGDGDVTMLRIMEQAGAFPSDLRDRLNKLKALDDVVAALQGGGTDVPMGSFTISGDEALKPVGQALDVAKVKDTLKNIINECGQVCRDRVND